MLVITFLEIFYLLFMFFFFETSYSFGSAIFDKQVQNIGTFFIHDTYTCENKICIFGKFMALIAIILALMRCYERRNTFTFNLIFDIICVILAALMNLNALVYIIPLILCEIYILFFM